MQINIKCQQSVNLYQSRHLNSSLRPGKQQKWMNAIIAIPISQQLSHLCTHVIQVHLMADKIHIKGTK